MDAMEARTIARTLNCILTFGIMLGEMGYW